jgi:ubiquinone biosynthesis monooxygenase Coq6
MRSVTPASARRALLAVSEPSTSRAAASIPRYLSSSRSVKRAAVPRDAAYQIVRSYATVTPAEPIRASIPPISAEDTFDIVIIGGANAGLALACALCRY